MIKVFTTNKNGKIELTKDELKKLLDEAYWDGYRANSNMYVYNSPSVWSPYRWDITCSNAATNYTLRSSDITSGTVTTDSINVGGPKEG